MAATIAAKVEVGLSAQRIYQDLVEQIGFSDSYQSVQRFVRKLKATQPRVGAWRLAPARKSRSTSVWEPRFVMNPTDYEEARSFGWS